MDFLYNIFGFLFRILFGFISDYGIALIIFTVFFRLLLLPSAVKQQKSQAKTVRLQPKLRRIREKYQDYSPQERQQKIQQETNELYQQEGYSFCNQVLSQAYLSSPSANVQILSHLLMLCNRSNRNPRCLQGLSAGSFAYSSLQSPLCRRLRSCSAQKREAQVQPA